MNHMGMEMTRVDFEHESDWSTLTLEDGTVLKVKVEVNGVIRATDKWDDNGEPIYQLNTPVRVAFVSVPENLMRPKPAAPAITPETVEEFGRKMDAVVKGKAN